MASAVDRFSPLPPEVEPVLQFSGRKALVRFMRDGEEVAPFLGPDEVTIIKKGTPMKLSEIEGDLDLLNAFYDRRYEVLKGEEGIFTAMRCLSPRQSQ